MNPSSQDIVAILEGYSSLSLVAGTDLFYSRMPSEPDDVVVIYDNMGGEPQLTMKKTTSDLYKPSITVWVRSYDYDIGYDLAFSIMQFLHAAGPVVENSTLYQLIRAKGDPALLHWDENDRAVFIVNFEIYRRAN